MIYLDGSHEAPNVLFDGMLSWGLLKPGGVLIFDDYLWVPQLLAGHRPQLAIDLFLRYHSGQYDLLHHGYQVAISKKQEPAQQREVAI